MEPIRPMENDVTADNRQTQSLAMAEVMRERYATQRAREMAPADPSHNADETDRRQDEKSHHRAAEAKSQAFTMRRTYAEFDVNQETREVSVRILDADSGDVIRVIPADDLVKELASGNLPTTKMRRLTIHM